MPVDDLEITSTAPPASIIDRTVSYGDSRDVRSTSTIRSFIQYTTNLFLSIIPRARSEPQRLPSSTQSASQEQTSRQVVQEEQQIIAPVTNAVLTTSNLKTGNGTNIECEIHKMDQTLMEELNCPICQDTYNDVQTTKCGHSFCHSCISMYLDRAQHCPLCRSKLTLADVHPSYSLKRIAQKHTHTLEIRSRKIQSAGENDMADPHCFQTDLKNTESVLKMKGYQTREDFTKAQLFCEFVNMMKESNLQQIENLYRNNTYIEHDLQLLTGRDSDARPTNDRKRKYSEMANVDIDNSNTLVDSSFSLASSRKSMTNEKACSSAIEAVGLTKQLRERYHTFEHIYKNIKFPQDTIAKRQRVLAEFSDTVYQITRCNAIKSVASFQFSGPSRSAVASALAFDRDEEYLAVGGVNKKIKLFNATADSANPLSIQPIKVLECEYKISCIDMSPSMKTQLVSADYGGQVNVFDVETGSNVTSYREHKRRAWSVDISRINSQLVASGSDDFTVKVWDLKAQSKRAQQSIQLQQNVCCAKFAPDTSDLLLVSSADHSISLYDVRKPSIPVSTYRGHERAVSYAQWLKNDQIISASIDGTLKLWDKESTECLETYSGHANAKNFVGLAAQGNWIACGSETNQVYLYHRSYNLPITTYTFPSVSIPTPSIPVFVSSVCWRKNPLTLTAANSLGQIQVLELQHSVY